MHHPLHFQKMLFICRFRIIYLISDLVKKSCISFFRHLVFWHFFFDDTVLAFCFSANHLTYSKNINDSINECEERESNNNNCQLSLRFSEDHQLFLQLITISFRNMTLQPKVLLFPMFKEIKTILKDVSCKIVFFKIIYFQNFKTK